MPLSRPGRTCASSQASNPEREGPGNILTQEGCGKAVLVQCTGRGNGEKDRSGYDPIADIRVTHHYLPMFGKIERNDVLNVVGAAISAFGFAAFSCLIYLQNLWVQVTPSVPDPARGYVYAHNEHGSITYFSAFQTTSCYLLFSAFFPIFAVGLFVVPKRNTVYRHKWLSFGMHADLDDPKKLVRVGFILGMLAAPTMVFTIGPSLVNGLIANGIILYFG